MKRSSRRGTARTVPALPVTSTMTQDMTSTTMVLTAVPRLDSTPSMPTLPRMAVRLANTAESTANTSQEPPAAGAPVEVASAAAVGLRSTIISVPARMSAMATTLAQLRGSPSSRKARSMVRTVLDLSMGTTLLTSPNWSALK